MSIFYPSKTLPPVPEGYAGWSAIFKPSPTVQPVEGVMAFLHCDEWAVTDSGTYGGRSGVPYMKAVLAAVELPAASEPKPQTRIRLDDGKYVLTIHDDGRITASRHGVPSWRDMTGDGLVMALAHKIEEYHEVLDGVLSGDDSSLDRANKLAKEWKETNR